jgi:hypothetical protein
MDVDSLTREFEQKLFLQRYSANSMLKREVTITHLYLSQRSALKRTAQPSEN